MSVSQSISKNNNQEKRISFTCQVQKVFLLFEQSSGCQVVIFEHGESIIQPLDQVTPFERIRKGK
jgi:hypothetical protein